MTRYLVMYVNFILTVNFMYNMSCAKSSSSHFHFNELVLSNFRLMYNVTVELRTQNSETLFRYIGSWNKIHYMVI